MFANEHLTSRVLLGITLHTKYRNVLALVGTATTTEIDLLVLYRLNYEARVGEGRPRYEHTWAKKEIRVINSLMTKHCI